MPHDASARVTVSVLKRLSARLPATAQTELRRLYFRRQIRARRFYTDEKEYALLDRLIAAGDWVLDIGANVGHYTMRMSELAGVTGRVIACEPVPQTFALLCANARLFAHDNVSLLNVAVSDRTGACGIDLPHFTGHLVNYYQAHLTQGETGLTVLTVALDALMLPPIKLAKIDVEGHELPVLRGMRGILERDHPTLIVETGAQETLEFLRALSYSIERLAGSSNVLCKPAD